MPDWEIDEFENEGGAVAPEPEVERSIDEFLEALESERPEVTAAVTEDGVLVQILVPWAAVAIEAGLNAHPPGQGDPYPPPPPKATTV